MRLEVEQPILTAENMEKLRHAELFSGGMAAVQAATDGKWGFVNRSGKLVIPCTYVAVSPFTEGIALVTGADGRRQFIDVSGRPAIPGAFVDAGRFCDGRAPVQIEEKWGYIDRQGTLVIPSIYDRAEPFANERAVVERADTYGIIDRSGHAIVEPRLGYIGPFHGDLAILALEAGPDTGFPDRGYIDRNGKIVWLPRILSTLLP